MGKLKDRLIELEDEGVIYYSEDLEYFVKVGGDPTKPFQLGDYNKPMPTDIFPSSPETVDK